MFTPADKVSLTVRRAEGFKCPPDKAQAFLWDADVRGLGVRATPNGQPSYIWQGHYAGKVLRVTIGQVSKVNLRDAVKAANGLNGDCARGIDPRLERRQEKAKSAAADLERAKAKHASQYTLGELGRAYVEDLRQRGRVSADEVSNLLKNHLLGSKQASIPANLVSKDDLLELLTDVTRAGKRTSNRVLTAVRAAYGRCLIDRAGADGNANPFKAFGVTSNPTLNIRPIEEGERSGKNPLTLGEMRTYWKACQEVPEPWGSFVRLHVLLGGPRMAQLAGLKVSDVKADYLELIDRKGKGNKARPYALPITKSIRAELALAVGSKTGDSFLWPAPNGGQIDRTTVSDWGSRAKCSIENFSMKRIRSGVETILAANGVSKDIRAELQSHGLTGVQKRSYDAHNYLDEKRAAIELLESLLSAPA